MDALSPFVHLVLRSLVLLFPLTVAWLAFRRLALSKSENAWTYAVICMFAVTITAAILPWTLGFSTFTWMLILLALSCPAVWILAILVLDLSRTHRYGIDPLISVAVKTSPKLAPLLLEDTQRADGTLPVFRHSRSKTTKPERAPSRSDATKAILRMARDIRENRSSDTRRPKLLPAPKHSEFPFLRS